MGLGPSKRMSLKSDLVTRIELELSFQGRAIDDIRRLEWRLQRMTIAGLKGLYGQILGERKERKGEREDTGEAQAGRSSLAAVKGSGKEVCVQQARSVEASEQAGGEPS